jgi:uncharacterized protein (UPF0548 family)
MRQAIRGSYSALGRQPKTVGQIPNKLLAPYNCSNPMLSILKPNERQALAFIDQQRLLPFSYPAVEHTRSDTPLPGFDNDFNTQELGQGEAVWEAAKEAIRQWKMFPGGWAYVTPKPLPIRPGEVVAMAARVLGIWWLNSCRIVYVIDNEQQFGFAYGTLPGHVECGEELFMVEKLADGSVRYVLKAFSKPRHWMARLGYHLARLYQKKFVRESKAAMVLAMSDER